MRINENAANFHALQSRARDASSDGVGKSSDAATGRLGGAPDATAGTDASVLDRIAAENAAAALSRVRDAGLAQQLADVTAAQILRNSEAALATQAHVAPETVVALLQSSSMSD